jgi:branched-chain amino acid transport system permease protein
MIVLFNTALLVFDNNQEHKVTDFTSICNMIFTVVFCLGASLAGLGGALGGPLFNAYPGLDSEMLPLALIVVILGGVGSLFGTFVASFIIGFIYTFGVALLPDLAYVILFLPMVIVIAFKPQGLFGRVAT